MLDTIVKKRIQALTLILVVSVFLTTTTAHAATELIDAEKGGKIEIAKGVWFVVKAKTLKADTLISAEMVKDNGRVSFIFGPCGTVFRKTNGIEKDKPAHLRVSWEALEDTEDLTLIGPGGEGIEPDVNDDRVVWKIPHFSLYYYRRR